MMPKFYDQDHVVFCGTKKKITVIVEQTSPSNTQVEKVGCALKEQQGLIVEYNAFGQMLADLLTKCLTEESNNSPRYILQFSETLEPHMLEIVETTDFRRLTHLAINFTAASDETLKAYLVSYIKRFKADHELTLEKFRHTESILSQQLASSSQMSNELKNKLEYMKESCQREVSDLKKQYESQMEQLASSNYRTVESLKSKHSSELKALQEAHKDEISCLRSKLESQASLLATNNICEDELKSQITALSKTLKESESTLNSVQSENDAQKSEILSLKVKIEQLQSNVSQVTAKHDSMESMFAIEQRRASSFESECGALRHQLRGIQEDLQKKVKQVEKLERLMKQQACEVTKANGIIKQLQKELKVTQNKAKLRGQVATEQEKVLTAKESELEEVQTALQDLRDRLQAEEGRREQGEIQISRLQASLEEAKKTIENNENIISWLNRQISESYTRSWQQRLKSTGITVMPSYMADKQPPFPTLLPSQFSLNSKTKNESLSGGLKPITGPSATSPSPYHPLTSSPDSATGLATNVTSAMAGAGSVPLTSSGAGLGPRAYGASPAPLSRTGKDNCLRSGPYITAPSVVTATNSNTVAMVPTAVASNQVPSTLNGITSEMAGLSVRPPQTLLSTRQQQPLHPDAKPLVNGTSVTSECESSLSRPPQPDQHQLSSLLSAYFPQAAGPS
ncbi:spindle assembly abnormal protein 6 [Echinococcus multilocularis]|uniref:Spindle assembly abnormal protein 6 n=1 Tax=Echinococcus multilocularis TaxID=6211 RepID=A0A068Y5Q8_ECHMU|nr:spindle assembly abnormal protein 6 [Echinococcus multilocularis]